MNFSQIECLLRSLTLGASWKQPTRRTSRNRPSAMRSLRILKRVGFVSTKTKPRIRYQASNGATILAMVRQGLGITLAPRGTLPDQLEGIVALPLEPSHQFEIGLIVKLQESASRAAQLFIQTALAWMHE